VGVGDVTTGAVTGTMPAVVRGGGRTSDRVYAALVLAIRELRISPGQQLGEQDLALELGVSRTPVREAIGRLVEAGLVVVVPQVGTRVAEISMREVREAQFVRESLEVAAFETACRLVEADLTDLRVAMAQQRLARSSGSLSEFFIADEALHAGIFRISGFPGAWRAVVRMKTQLDRLRRLSTPDIRTADELIEEHAAIVESLALRDAQAGVAHIRRHARRVLGLERTLRQQYPDYFVE